MVSEIVHSLFHLFGLQRF